jgi:hypothetical protein
MRSVLLLFFALLVAGFSGALVQNGAASNNGQPTGNLFEGDRRLEQPLTLDAREVPLRHALRQIRRQLVVSLAVQGDLLRRPVALDVRGIAASEIFVELAAQVSATWIKDRGSYLLVTDEAVTRQALANRAPQAFQHRKKALVASLSASQVQALQQQGRLLFNQLTPGQRTLFLALLADEFAGRIEQHPGTIVEGVGAELQWLKGVPEKAPPAVLFCAPLVLESDQELVAPFTELYLPEAGTPAPQPGQKPASTRRARP